MKKYIEVILFYINMSFMYDKINYQLEKTMFLIYLSRIDYENFEYFNKFSIKLFKHVTNNKILHNKYISNDRIRRCSLDWMRISHDKNISFQDIKEYKDKIYWNLVRIELPEDIIIEYYNELNWNYIFKTQKLSLDTINTILCKYKTLNIDNPLWFHISGYDNLPCDMIIKYHQYLNWIILLNYERSKEDVVTIINSISNTITQIHPIWNYISKYNNLDCDFIIKYHKYLNWSLILKNKFDYILIVNSIYIEINKDHPIWDHIVKHCDIEDKFAYKYHKYLDWNYISQYHKLSESWMTYNMYFINWSLVTQHQKLSCSFITKHKEDVDWYYICQYEKLSEECIDNNMEYIIWSLVSYYQNLFPSFISKYKDKLDWYIVCRCRILTEECIIDNVEYIIWPLVSQYQKLSCNFITNYRKELDWYIICRCRVLTEECMIENIEYIIWTLISQYQKLSPSFITKYRDKLDWKGICQYQTLSEECMDDNKQYIIWPLVSQYQKLSCKFITKYKEEVDWKCICQYQVLTKKYIFDNVEYIIWPLVFKYQKLDSRDIHKEIIKRSYHCDPYTEEILLGLLYNNYIRII